MLLRWLGLVGGVGLLVLGSTSIVFTLVLPRAHPSRLADAALRGIHGASRLAADQVSSYEVKDRLMAFAGPLALLGLFTVWLTVFFFGYSLVLWPLVPGSLGDSLGEALR